ncbi:MAG: tetratricopeptide repeat protein [Planctomycetota bacterium]
MRNLALIAVVCFLTVAVTGCRNPVSNVVTFGKQFRAQGVKHYDAGDYERARSAFEEATEQNPSDYLSHYYLGQTYRQQGKDQLAIQALNTALRVRLTTGGGRKDIAARNDITFALGQAVAESPSGDAALNKLEFDARTENKADFWMAVAEAYRARGDADNALDAYAQAAEAAPSDPFLAKRYAFYADGLGQSELAGPLLINAYDLQPEDPEVIAALEANDIIPGPSLRSRDKLVDPIIPKGPLPQFRAGFEDNRNEPIDLDEVRRRYEDGE